MEQNHLSGAVPDENKTPNGGTPDGSAKPASNTPDSSANPAGGTPGGSAKPATPDANQQPTGAVPVDISSLIGAQTFDIGKHKVEDFHTTARREANKSLSFSLGRPAGTSMGAALITNKTAQIKGKFVARRSGKSIVRYALPTPEFAATALQRLLVALHLIPILDVTGPEVMAILWAFQITSWPEYAKIFNALAALDDERNGLYVRYIPGPSNQPGIYNVESFPLEPRHIELRKQVSWPTPADLPLLVESVPFQQLCEENYNLKRLWQAIQARGGQGQ